VARSVVVALIDLRPLAGTQLNKLEPQMSKTGVAIIIVIIVFGVLHVTAGVLLHDASAAPPTEPSKLAIYGD
jgi:hypothetical protein